MVITPAGRSPGISRAARGRSRHPVASSTAAACTVSMPSALVIVTACEPSGPGAQPVTVVPSRTSAPAATAASARARAYAGPVMTRRRSRSPYPVCQLCRGTPPGSASRSATSTGPAPSRRSSAAADSPAGPAPTTRTSRSRCWRSRCWRSGLVIPAPASSRDTAAAQ